MVNLRNKDKLEIIHGDLFSIDVEAIINPTNTDLLMGAGLGGQIRKKGGSDIQEECLEIHSIPPGRAAVTSGGALKCRNIIHAAIMKIGGFATEDFITGAIRSAGNRIRELSLKSVAFPPMGTGVGRFPLRRSAEIMIETILDDVCGIRDLEKVYIVLSDEEMCSLFEDTYTRITGDKLVIEVTQDGAEQPAEDLSEENADIETEIEQSEDTIAPADKADEDPEQQEEQNEQEDNNTQETEEHKEES